MWTKTSHRISYNSHETKDLFQLAADMVSRKFLLEWNLQYHGDDKYDIVDDGDDDDAAAAAIVLLLLLLLMMMMVMVVVVVAVVVVVVVMLMMIIKQL